jgi:hypothetical protein
MFEKHIIIPEEFEFETHIDQIAWEYGVETALIPFLKEEMKDHREGRKHEGVHYEFECPHCNFRSKYFYCVCLHIAYSRDCFQHDLTSPCYPINHCYIERNGKKYQYIP